MTWDTVQAQLNAFASLTIPVPDAFLIIAACVAIALISVSARRSRRDAVAEVEALYLSELARANRKAQAAASRLKQMHSEIEKHRRLAKSR